MVFLTAAVSNVRFEEASPTTKLFVSLNPSVKSLTAPATPESPVSPLSPLSPLAPAAPSAPAPPVSN